MAKSTAGQNLAKLIHIKKLLDSITLAGFDAGVFQHDLGLCAHDAICDGIKDLQEKGIEPEPFDEHPLADLAEQQKPMPAEIAEVMNDVVKECIFGEDEEKEYVPWDYPEEMPLDAWYRRPMPEKPSSYDTSLWWDGRLKSRQYLKPVAFEHVSQQSKNLFYWLVVFTCSNPADVNPSGRPVSIIETPKSLFKDGWEWSRDLKTWHPCGRES